MKLFKKIIVLLVLMSAGISVQAAEPYQIFGDIGDLVKTGEVILTKSSDVIGGTFEINRGKVVNGQFSLKGSLEEVDRVNLSVTDAEGEYKGKVVFILETGNIEVTYHGKVAGLSARGGPYNQLVISSWERSDDYQAALKSYSGVLSAMNALAEGDTDKKAELQQKAGELYNQIQKIKFLALNQLAKTSKDPMAIFLAIQMGAQATMQLDELEQQLGKHSGLAAKRKVMEAFATFQKNASAIKTGTQIKDFFASNIAGENFHLAEVLRKNKYVLVEFWASWCGPCRADIPHMKEAYQRFHKQGFEIVSFSLDDDGDAWREASDEEALPWINTSDLKAYDSPVALRYGVTMIPQNYLVDATGKIVAINLRKEALDNKLVDLLKE